MAVQVDSDSDEETLNNGETIELEVHTDSELADRVVLMVDDGTTGNAPAAYDLEQQVYVNDQKIDDYMRYDKETGLTASSVVDPAISRKFKAIITNASGGQANFRATLHAESEGT